MASKKKRPGRPVGPNGARTELVKVRLTARELVDIDRAARRARLTRSEWVRRQLSVAARQLEVPGT